MRFQPAQRRLFYPIFILLAALIVAGCSADRQESAHSGQTTAANSGAVQSAAPEGRASPPAVDAAASARPSEPAGSTAQPSAGTQADVEAAGGSAPPEPTAGTGTDSVPAGTSAQAAHSPVPGTAGAAAAKASAAPGAGGGASAGPAEASAKPAATARPSAGTKPPGATAKPAAGQQPPSPQAAASAPPEVQTNTATVSIIGDSEHGVILAAAAYEIKDGESAIELLKRLTRKLKIPMEYQGAKGFAYVEGIDNLYEFDHGAESGWMFKVNGEFLNKGAGSYTVQSGDTIEWLYTLDLGKDLGAKAP